MVRCCMVWSGTVGRGMAMRLLLLMQSTLTFMCCVAGMFSEGPPALIRTAR